MAGVRARGLALLGLLSLACGGVARSADDGTASGAGSTGASASASNGTSGGPSTNGSFGGTSFGASGGDGASTAGGTASGGSFLIGDGSASAGSAGSSSSLHAALVCENPMPGPHGGGYSTCTDGSFRRASAAACDSALPRATPDLPIVGHDCSNDTDCVASPHGYCVYGGCKYGCVTDDECPADQACFCGRSIGTCVPAYCHSDADCPSDFPCSGYVAAGFDLPDALACQSGQDECLTSAQCGDYDPRLTCKFQVDYRVCYSDPVE